MKEVFLLLEFYEVSLIEYSPNIHLVYDKVDSTPFRTTGWLRRQERDRGMEVEMKRNWFYRGFEWKMMLWSNLGRIFMVLMKGRCVREEWGFRYYCVGVGSIFLTIQYSYIEISSWICLIQSYFIKQEFVDLFSYHFDFRWFSCNINSSKLIYLF